MNSSSSLTAGNPTATMGANAFAASDPVMNINLPLLAARIDGKRVIVAFFACMIYELIITQERRVALFSKRPWSRPKVLFLLNRYVAPITLGILTV